MKILPLSISNNAPKEIMKDMTTDAQSDEIWPNAKRSKSVGAEVE
jgi:hypothetical protein